MPGDSAGGRVTGQIQDYSRHNRLQCYCRDCQAFAHYLGQGENVLDENGGTDIVQIPAAAFSIETGMDQLHCVRLSPTGLHRWYAGCCNTPIGNTSGIALPFIGLIHSCLTPHDALEHTFGPVGMVVFTKSAVGANPPVDKNMIGGIFAFAKLALGAKLRGEGQRHPLFHPSGEPIVEPEIANPDE